MWRVAVALGVMLGANAYAFAEQNAATLLFWLILAVATLGLAALALHRLWFEGTLLDVLKPRWGDLSVGVLVSALLLSASWVARAALAPAGTPRQAWLWRVYLQLGNPEMLQRSVGYTALILVIAAAEELVWRGMVQAELSQRLGPRGAWPLCSALYALSLLPTAFTLRDPLAGPNPLLVTAALGCGIVWSFLAGRSKRLFPGVISHMAFTYFSIVQFRWPGM